MGLNQAIRGLDKNDVMMYNYVMHRTQILLEERQYAALKSWGKRADKSLSEVIRTAVDRLLEAEKPKRRGASKLKALCGKFSDPGLSGRDHDRVLYGGPA